MLTPVVFAGSFDPVTNGHVQLVRRAQVIFGAVIVLVMPNGKKQTLFSLQERKQLLEEAFKNDPQVKVDAAHGLLADYMKQQGLKVLVRGIRNTADLEYENMSMAYNRSFYPDLETIFLPADVSVAHISSSAVKEAFDYGADVSAWVPAYVVAALKRKAR